MQPLRGSLRIPGDKSLSHRYVLLSLLFSGTTRLGNLSPCSDVRRSLWCYLALGGSVGGGEDGWLELSGLNGRLKESAVLDCGNSGTTTRLLMGLLAPGRGRYRLDGDRSLRGRPMLRVARPLSAMGADIGCTDGGCPVEISGRRLAGRAYRTPVASAQLKSALLLAGVRSDGMTTVSEPYPSRDHTERLLEAAGARIHRSGLSCTVMRSELASPGMITVPGDPSSAAFLVCAALLVPGSDIELVGVLLNPTRTGFLDVLKRMGADLEVRVTRTDPEPVGDLRVRHTPGLRAFRVGPDEIPSLIDEVPVLSLMAARAEGRSVLTGVSELRVKETDRLSGTVEALRRMGAGARSGEDELVIEGPADLDCSAGLRSHGDHRLAMMLRVACLAAGGGRVQGEECCRISFPGFHDALVRLGGAGAGAAGG
jgi:3-phosphoshikimate 1-carboxyvinyltransferase